MIEFVNKYARNYSHSQNGEEGLLIEILSRLDLCSGYCVEIGGNDGQFCSNTALLLERGFSGKFIETEWPLYLKCQANWAHRKDVKCICSRVDGHNVNAFVNDDCDVLSIDTDGSDYEIFKGLKAKPKIVIVEIDSSIPPDRDEFNADGGAGYYPMVWLGIRKGYRLLCHTGNLVFIREDDKEFFPELKGKDPFIHLDQYFNRGWLKEDAA